MTAAAGLLPAGPATLLVLALLGLTFTLGVWVYCQWANERDRHIDRLARRDRQRTRPGRLT